MNVHLTRHLSDLILHQNNHIPHRKDLMSELAQLNDFDDQLYKVTKGHAGHGKVVVPLGSVAGDKSDVT